MRERVLRLHTDLEMKAKSRLKLPRSYSPYLDVRETEVAIKLIKDSFQRKLSKSTQFAESICPAHGQCPHRLNDNLNGVEKPSALPQRRSQVEIVQSLAKWKREALHRYAFYLVKVFTLI